MAQRHPADELLGPGTPGTMNGRATSTAATTTDTTNAPTGTRAPVTERPSPSGRRREPLRRSCPLHLFRPNSPSGLNSRTAGIRMNAGASGIFSNPGTYWGTTDEAIPTTKPPTTAPSRLSNPPR